MCQMISNLGVFLKALLTSEPYFHLVIQWKTTLVTIILSGRNKRNKVCLFIMIYSKLIPHFNDDQLVYS